MRIKKIVLTVLFLAVPFFTFANNGTQKNKNASLRSIDTKKIAEHKQRIEKMMNKHWAMRVAFPIGVAAGCGFGIYWYLIRKNSDVKALEGISVPIKKPSFEQRLSFNENVISKIRNNIKKNSPNFFTFQFLKNRIVDFIKYYTFGSTISFATSLYKKFFHDDTIAWFVKEKTQCARLCEDMKVYFVKIVKTDGLKDQDSFYYKETLIGVAKNFVVHVEQIVAFMEYKIAWFEKRGAFIANDERLQISHLIATTNTFVRSMQTLKSDSSLADIKEAFRRAMQFVVDFEQQIKRFGGIEHAVEWRLTHG